MRAFKSTYKYGPSHQKRTNVTQFFGWDKYADTSCRCCIYFILQKIYKLFCRSTAICQMPAYNLMWKSFHPYREESGKCDNIALLFANVWTNSLQFFHDETTIRCRMCIGRLKTLKKHWKNLFKLHVFTFTG